MKFKMDWNRVFRTFVQAASGAGISLLAAISMQFDMDSFIAAAISFAVTTLTAVLMNIKSQTEEQE